MKYINEEISNFKTNVKASTLSFTTRFLNKLYLGGVSTNLKLQFALLIRLLKYFDSIKVHDSTLNSSFYYKRGDKVYDPYTATFYLCIQDITSVPAELDNQNYFLEIPTSEYSYSDIRNAMIRINYILKTYWNIDYDPADDHFNVVDHEILVAYWDEIYGNQILDSLGGDALILSSPLSGEYIPATYSGTITAPSNSVYSQADTEHILYNTSGIPIAKTVTSLVSQDFSRVVVKYDNVAPYHIRSIGLIKQGLTLTQDILNWLHSEFDLNVFWSGDFNKYGSFKNNRIIP